MILISESKKLMRKAWKDLYFGWCKAALSVFMLEINVRPLRAANDPQRWGRLWRNHSPSAWSEFSLILSYLSKKIITARKLQLVCKEHTNAIFLHESFSCKSKQCEKLFFKGFFINITLILPHRSSDFSAVVDNQNHPCYNKHYAHNAIWFRVLNLPLPE